MLIWNIQSSREENLLSCDSCKMYKISTSQNRNDLQELSFWYQALSCGVDFITSGVYIWVKLANHSVHNNLFLTLRIIHKFKKQWTALGGLSTENGSAVDCWMALWNLIVSLWQDVIHCVRDPQQSTAVKRHVLRDTLKNTVFPSIPH